MKNTETKPGYKKTKIGWIPEDWELINIGDIGTFSKGKGIAKDEIISKGIPAVHYGEIYTTYNIYIKQFKSFISKESANYSFQLFKDDLLFAGSGESIEDIGKCVAFIDDIEAYVGGDIIVMRNHKQNSKYLAYALNSDYYRNQTHKIGQGHSVVHIYAEGLKKINIPLPPLPEQQKIAEILTTWDNAIEQTQKLVEQLKLRKKGLMQQLLTGKIRLKGFSGEWKKYQIGELASNYNRLNSDIKIQEVFSCTKYDGLVRSLEYFGRRVFGEDLSKYKVVPFGYFAYATNHIEEGSIGYQDKVDYGLVSPMYTVFKTKNLVYDPFFYKLLKTDNLINLYQSNMSGSIARRGGLRWNVFETIVVKIPSVNEQIEIDKILSASDNEIKAQEKYLEQLQSQKKGLMQQLLTGQKRVKV